MPEAFKQLDDIGKKLERHYKDVQDVEFTVQRGKVWMLQTRNAKRTGFAAVRIAVDLVNEGLITEQEALQTKRIPADDLNQLLQPIFDPEGQEDSRRPRASCWPRASTPARAPPRARSASTPPTPKPIMAQGSPTSS